MTNNRPSPDYKSTVSSSANCLCIFKSQSTNIYYYYLCERHNHDVPCAGACISPPLIPVAHLGWHQHKRVSATSQFRLRRCSSTLRGVVTIAVHVAINMQFLRGAIERDTNQPQPRELGHFVTRSYSHRLAHSSRLACVNPFALGVIAIQSSTKIAFLSTYISTCAVRTCRRHTHLSVADWLATSLDCECLIVIAPATCWLFGCVCCVLE